MNHFELALKNEKLLYYHRMAVLLLILNFAAFIIVAIYATTSTTRTFAIVGVAATTFGLAMAYWQYATVKEANDKRNVIGLFFAAVCWGLMQSWVAAVICLLVQVFYSISIRKQIVTVISEGVQYPFLLGTSTAKWNELNNVVLKDGLLTIDFKNNKIIQAEITETQPVNEPEFNRFCNARLTGNSAAV